MVPNHCLKWPRSVCNLGSVCLNLTEQDGEENAYESDVDVAVQWNVTGIPAELKDKYLKENPYLEENLKEKENLKDKTYLVENLKE